MQLPQGESVAIYYWDEKESSSKKSFSLCSKLLEALRMAQIAARHSSAKSRDSNLWWPSRACQGSCVRLCAGDGWWIGAEVGGDMARGLKSLPERLWCSWCSLHLQGLCLQRQPSINASTIHGLEVSPARSPGPLSAHHSRPPNTKAMEARQSIRRQSVHLKCFTLDVHLVQEAMNLSRSSSRERWVLRRRGFRSS